jgi:Cd2+/Zn2+-exporting ATPase
MCPCAFVLATPTALVAAIGHAGRRGILVKSAANMERAGKVNVVAFDKTGTLTRGKMVVEEVVSFNKEDAHSVLRSAASVERFSEHPIGCSIVSAAEERAIKLGEPSDFTGMPGFGVKARIEGKEVITGNRALLEKQGLSLPDRFNDIVKGLEQRGRTAILVAIDGVIEGVITLADEIRPEAKKTVSELKSQGVTDIILITGDSPDVAQKIADDAGIDRFYAEVLPQDKQRIIREFQMQGSKVAFVGDGVNDAPALASADIGIAMGTTGTDLALETADVNLMKDDISRVPYIIGLSRRSLRIIWINIAFSMSINVISVVLGSLGIIGPVVGALMHEFSALPVLVNSARLIGYRTKSHPGRIGESEPDEDEEHLHVHLHEVTTHTHLHSHSDMHHLHEHDGVFSEPHVHAHAHFSLSHAHSHSHEEDIHHKHAH